MKDLKTNLANKLLNVVVNGIVLESALVGLDENLHIHIFDKNIHMNRARRGDTHIWGCHLPLLQQRNCGFALRWYYDNHEGYNTWTTNSSSRRDS